MTVPCELRGGKSRGRPVSQQDHADLLETVVANGRAIVAVAGAGEANGLAIAALHRRPTESKRD